MKLWHLKNLPGLLAAIALLWGATPPAHAAGEQTIVYGGRLVLPTGAPVSGPVNLRVTFYHQSSAGTPVGDIALTFNSVPLTDGMFQINIALTPEEWHQVLPAVSQPVYIEIENLTHGGSYPRQLYNAVPYAMKVPVDNKTIRYDTKGQLTLGDDVKLRAGATEHFVALKAHPASADGTTFTLPQAPDAGKYLSTDAGGNLSWTTPVGAGDMQKSTYDGNSDNLIDLAAGGTGANSAAGARTNLGLGTAATLNAGVAANQLVQLDGTARLPPVDGSQLTNINVASITDNTIVNADINASAAIDRAKLASGTADHVVINNGSGVLTSEAQLALTRGGTGANSAAGARTNLGLGTAALQNVGVAAGNAVQLDGSARLPAVDGSQVTNLNASSLSSGTVANGRINWGAPSAIGSTTPASGTFTTLTTDNTGLRFTDNDGTAHYIILKSPAAMTGDQTYTLPAAADAGKFLTTDGSGNMSWGTPAGAGDMQKSTYDVNADNLIDLDKGGTGASTAAGARTNLGLGTAATLNVGTGSNNVMQLDVLGRAPNVDGSQLTNVNASTITDGTVVNADVAAGAAIDRSKIANGSANQVVINNGSGGFSSEAQLALSRGGTGANLSATGGAGQYLKQSSSGGAVSVGTIAAADYPTMVGDSGAGGAKGAVPAPASGDAAKFLRGDGTWGAPSVTAAGVGGLTTGSVPFSNGTGLTQDNANLAFDNSNKRLGVGTNAPKAPLDVAGQILSRVYNAGASTSIDWNQGNVQYSSRSCGAFTFENMHEGGSYTLVVTGGISDTCTFSQAVPDVLGGAAFKFVPANGPTMPTTTTIYTFLRAGGLVYVTWIKGY